MCITVTTMRTQKSSITKTPWPQTVLTLAMFADSTVLPFSKADFTIVTPAHGLSKLALFQHRRLHGWLSFHRGQCSRWGCHSKVGPVIHLMDDVRIVFLKTIFWSFSRAPMLQLKLSAAKLNINKQTTPSPFDSNLKKILEAKGTPRSVVPS